MIQIILSSIAFLLVIVFAFCVLGRGVRSFSSYVLLLAIIATSTLEIFDLFSLLHPENFLIWKKLSLMAEAFLPFLYLSYSVTYARKCEVRSISISQRVLVAVSMLIPVFAAVLPVSAVFYSPDFASERMLFLGNAGFFFYIAFLLILVIALINLEITFANASREARWMIKFELLGMGAMLSVLIFYYSQGLLYRSINMNLVPLRTVALIAAMGMMLYSRLWRGNNVRIVVSRQMAFRSIVLSVFALYLISLGLLGEALKYFGDSFQKSLIMAIALLSGIGILAVFLSETAKRKIKVFLHKNFYPQKYDYKTQWLSFTDRLASAKTGDELLKSIISGFCETFGMGCGALYLQDSEREVYQCAADLNIDSSQILFRANDPLLTIMSTRQWVIHIPGQMPEVNAEQTVFLARVPIVFSVPLLLNDNLEGFIFLGRPHYKNETYNYEDYDLMKALARHASSAILNLRLSDELFRAREMETIGKLSAFMVHDLKNLVTTLALVVDNAKQFIDNPEFQVDMLESLDSTVAKMNTLILKLKKFKDKGCSHYEFADLMDIAGNVARQFCPEEVKLHGVPVYSVVDKEEIHKLLLNLILNAIDASGGSGDISIEVGCKDTAYIRVSDEGCGMTEDFLQKHLFKPFQTTKGKGLGIGLYQCKQIAEAHGGRIEVESTVGVGSTFTVCLPVCVDERGSLNG